MSNLFDTITIAEEFEIDSTSSININTQKMVLETVSAFFNIKPGNDGNYGLNESDINEINTLEEKDRFNKFLEKKGIPKTEQPGLSNLIDKLIKCIIKSVSFFVKQFIVMKESAMSLINALKNPTKPENVKKITNIVNKLKGLIEDIKKIFTDTINWIKETFMGPISDINIPVPSFNFNLGEIVPAFPFILPIPEIKPKNLDDFNKPTIEGVKIKNETIDNKISQMYGYEKPSNIALMNIYKSTPYLQYVNTNSLVVNTFDDSLSDKTKGSSELKKINLFKSIATTPLKIIIGLINTLLGAIIGLISFDFSKVKELIKMMIPSYDSIKILLSKIVNTIIPGASETVDKNGNVEPPNNLEELKTQQEKAKSIKIENDSNENIKNDIKEKILEYEKNVEEIIEYKNEIINNSNEKPLFNYIENIKNISNKILENEIYINNILSDIFIPNKFQVNNKVILVNEILSNINTLDNKFDDNGNEIENKYNENLIVDYFDNIHDKLKNINEYKNNYTEINDFFDYYNNVENFPLKSNFIDDYIYDNQDFINLNKNKIEIFFDKYNIDNISETLNNVNESIEYVKKLEYIKIKNKNKLNKLFTEYKNLLIDFNNNLNFYDLTDNYENNINIIDNPIPGQNPNLSSDNQDNIILSGWTIGDNFDFEKIENKYEEISNYVNSELYLNFKNYLPLNNRILIENTIINSVSYFNNFDRYSVFIKNNIEILIDNINNILNFDNYNNILYLENDISNINYENINEDIFDQSIIIKYLRFIKNLYKHLYDLIIEDESLNILDDNNNKIKDSIRNKCKDFLIKIIEYTDNLKNNKDNLYLVLNDINEYNKLEEKRLGQDNSEIISQTILPITNLINFIPNILLSIFKELFNYALEDLPNFLKPS